MQKNKQALRSASAVILRPQHYANAAEHAQKQKHKVGGALITCHGLLLVVNARHKGQYMIGACCCTMQGQTAAAYTSHGGTDPSQSIAVTSG
jgi:hypothetical protein